MVRDKPAAAAAAADLEVLDAAALAGLEGALVGVGEGVLETTGTALAVLLDGVEGGDDEDDDDDDGKKDKPSTMS